MALTTDDVRARVETDLDEPTVQRILTAAEKAVTRAAGSADDQTATFLALGASQVSLPRRHSEIVSVKERASRHADQVTLASDDYREIGDYVLQRLANGTNGASYWGSEVEVVYTPEVDATLRERVVLDLCQLDIEFKAVDVEAVGDYKQEQKDFRARKRALLAEVREGRSSIL